MNRLCGIMFCMLTTAFSTTLWAQQNEYGLVNLSVATMHEKGDWSSDTYTQAVLGSPVQVLEEARWCKVLLPDSAECYLHESAFHRVTEQELKAWNAAPQVVVTAHFGLIYVQPREKSETLGDVVAGCRLRLLGKKGRYYKVAYPDGREGYLLKSVAMPLDVWKKQLKIDAESLIATAKSMMGFPYLWAGTSSKAMDCSGFVRNVLLMHNLLMPRDSGQQAKVGERIELFKETPSATALADFTLLQPGDLVFFGRPATEATPEKVVHVGISLGGARFIHSQGNVHISSFDPDDELYDDYNRGRVLFATRFLPYINKVDRLTTLDVAPYYAQ